MRNYLRQSILAISLFIGSSYAYAQCADTVNIYSFVYNGKTYEVVRENKTWVNAADCAVERGGYLAEINDSLEQDAVFLELNTNASIVTANTVAPDGGNASYVWIGGNDLAIEGDWIWDGDNDSNGPQFWQGTTTGIPVGGLFNNWGNEPDDFQGQDGLGLALTNWPLGTIGQWNDVDHDNTLYFVIEYEPSSGLNDIGSDDRLDIYPNPVKEHLLFVKNKDHIRFDKIVLRNAAGQEIKTLIIKDGTSCQIDVSDTDSGVYLIEIQLENGKSIFEKIVKR